MNIDHEVELTVHLEPVWHNTPPEILIGIDQPRSQVLSESKYFKFNFNGHGKHRLILEMTNKSNSDTVPSQGLDKAVIIRSIDFYGISDPRFIWMGRYKPQYPEPWFSQQQNRPPEILVNQDRLSWNGPWVLEFEIPVFTWIHRALNLGWIYD